MDETVPVALGYVETCVWLQAPQNIVAPPFTCSALELQVLENWLYQGPLLMDGARWFGEGRSFVGIGYDSNGIYIRDSSGWDKR
jgi:hypothetical protein